MNSVIPKIIIWICDTTPPPFSLEDWGFKMKTNMCKGSGKGRIFIFIIITPNNTFSLTWF